MGNNKEIYIPCDGCILLVKCIQIYKEELESDVMFPAYGLIYECKLFRDEYYKHPQHVYDGFKKTDEPINTPLDDWWKDNYGK